MLETMDCPLCGTSDYEIADGDTHRWMWVSCQHCELCLEVRKANYAEGANSTANRIKAIGEWQAIAQRIRDEALATREAEIEVALEKAEAEAEDGGYNYRKIAKETIDAVRRHLGKE